MGKLRIMSRRGDTVIEWDEKKVAEGDPEARAAVKEAERIFAEERARGSTAFKVEPGRTARRLEDFDDTADQIVIVPRVAGG